ncbi:MAG TPA: hypothetical protein VNS12_02390 [Pelagibacterium sp.]|uniref:hypothetical protein n=1 Tax=Pelagibacterium sp. TaxID=1967288 RepID=UPI002B87EAB9|nr:hypothetical protein [Pelagibacterium sp.]HWJ86901.1 hypothetical protein [Pelagibacterium sp.]
MTLLNTSAHRSVALPAPAAGVPTHRLRTVDGQYLHQDLSQATLVDGSTWAWMGTKAQMQAALRTLPPALVRQLLPTTLDGLPVRFWRHK